MYSFLFHDVTIAPFPANDQNQFLLPGKRFRFFPVGPWTLGVQSGQATATGYYSVDTLLWPLEKVCPLCGSRPQTL